jgi:FHA domain
VATCPSGHQSASNDFCDVCGVLIGAAPSLAPEAAPAGAAWTGAGTAAGPGVTVGGSRLTPGDPCPRCGATRAGQFCESCGYDFTLAGQDTFGPDAFGAGAYPPAPPPPPSAPAQPAPVSSAPVWSAPVSSVSPAAGPAAAGPATQAPPSAPVRPASAADLEWSAVVSADRAYYESIQAAGGPDAAAIAFPAYFPQRRFRLAGNEVRIGRHSASSGIDPEIDLSVPPADPGVSRLHAVLLKAPDGTWSVIDPGSANGTVVNGAEIPSGEAVPLRDGDRIHLGAWTELRVVRGS